MDREAIETRAMEILKNTMGPPYGEPYRPDQPWHDMGMDSLDQLQFLMDLEDEWELDIEDAEAERCKTVRDAVDLIASKVS